jgi:glycine oxidase
MAKHPDVLIVGGGVIGLTTAYFLAREGVRVEVVDRGDFGLESSWAGAGILSPGNPARARHPYDRFLGHSTAMFPDLSAELRQRTGIDNGYLRCGGLELVEGGDDTLLTEWRQEGIVCEPLDHAGLAKLEPALSSAFHRGFYLPDMAQLRNPRHMKALLAGCGSLGVRLRPGCPVHGLEKRENRITAVHAAEGSLPAGWFLLAAGAWTESLLEQVGWRPGIRPIRGQIALLKTGVPLFGRILLQGKRYLVPRPDGRVLVGSTEEDAGFDKRTTTAGIGGLLSLATDLVPGLAVAQIERCWAGLRPGSPDGMPYLGAVPGFDNLCVAAGHFRAGIQLSPATAQVLKELYLGQPLTLPVEPFQLDRRAGAAGSHSAPGAVW